MSNVKLIHGDSLIELRQLADNSVDAVVTDPPYGLSFMGKKWDYQVPSVELWAEVIRVLKPGGHLLSFGGTRTYHRMVVNIEDAGFEIRDCIQWIYGSGFPKSQDISKAIDKQAGATREIIGSRPLTGNGKTMKGGNYHQAENESDKEEKQAVFNFTAPATPEAKTWQGWGTALKPANEPIVVARKPLESKLTVAANVLKHGTGGLNIDGSRIASTPEDFEKRKEWADKYATGNQYGKLGTFNKSTEGLKSVAKEGRWPANVIFDEESAAVLDEQSGQLSKQGSRKLKDCPSSTFAGGSKDSTFYGDSGGASRFFYVAKASKKERGEGNNHPTVKPIKLMEYLVELVTPPNGTVLDPFMGSGTTGVACRRLNFSFVGIEREQQYLEIAEKRINGADK